jgi:signal transduction histidine kinase
VKEDLEMPVGQNKGKAANRSRSGSANYGRFAAMIATSTVAMYGLMYLNTYAIGHVFFSQTRAWMALYMGAMMAVIMLAFMLGMYADRSMNMAIFAGAAIAFVLGVWMVRSQATVGDIAWMKAMIPHHSIAVLTSERADLSDPRVRALAKAIIEAQRNEIAEMQAYVADIAANGDAAPGTPRAKPE